LFTSPSKERIDEEMKLFPNAKNAYYDYEKEQKLHKYINPNCDFWDAHNIICKSPKLLAIVESFELPDVNEPIVFRYGGEKLFESFIFNIANNKDIEMEICGVIIKMMGTLFKPRGHYTKSLKLENYFRAFTWLSKFDIIIDKNDANDANGLILAAIIAKITEPHTLEIENFQNMQKYWKR
jgi:hypothetical protein